MINFVRALGAAEAARSLGPVASSRPVAVAPDFTFTSGVGEARALKDWRGRGVVLLVLFTLPDSADRLVALNRIVPALRLRGGDLLRAPRGYARPLPGSRRPAGVLSPRRGRASEAGAAYMLFRRDLSAEGQRPEPPPVPHMELLVDRQGYLRARWIPRDLTLATDGWADTGHLLTEIDRLAARRRSRRSPRSTSIDRLRLMRLWKVILLLNIALGVGIGLGYLRWARRSRPGGAGRAASGRGRPARARRGRFAESCDPSWHPSARCS